MEEQQKSSVKISEIYVVAKALESAIRKVVFSEEELGEFYKSWSSVIRFCEDAKRTSEIEDLYKQKKAADAKAVSKAVATAVANANTDTDDLETKK